MENTSSKSVDISTLKEFQIQNYKDASKKALVTPLREKLGLIEKDFENIKDICNQPLVYEFIFNEKLIGKPYSIEKAHDFLTWSEKGWSESTHFPFVIRDEEKRIIGAIDIKSNNPVNAEVGYWIDGGITGFMTNALIGLVSMAKEAGYKSLTALARQDNYRSKGVLVRAGFKNVGQEEDKKTGRIRDKFELQF
ncbi:MAG: GNAT family N-acetyltransferase [bacterium]